mmetsp:Transcript_53789/g.155206  ORF Transcript_53789/g.155206 Transcript_53789/m.155206 type:complete len:568 (-) Transcript_53789:80-1783(-)
MDWIGWRPRGGNRSDEAPHVAVSLPQLFPVPVVAALVSDRRRQVADALPLLKLVQVPLRRLGFNGMVRRVEHEGGAVRVEPRVRDDVDYAVVGAGEEEVEIPGIGCLELAPLLRGSVLPKGEVEQIFVFWHGGDPQLAVREALARRKHLVSEIPPQPLPQPRQGVERPRRVRMAPPHGLLRAGPVVVAVAGPPDAVALVRPDVGKEMDGQDGKRIVLCDLRRCASEHSIGAGGKEFVRVQLDAHSHLCEKHGTVFIEIEAPPLVRLRQWPGMQQHELREDLRIPTTRRHHAEVHYNDGLLGKGMHGAEQLGHHPVVLPTLGAVADVIDPSPFDPTSAIVCVLVVLPKTRVQPHLHDVLHGAGCQGQRSGSRQGVAPLTTAERTERRPQRLVRLLCTRVRGGGTGLGAADDRLRRIFLWKHRRRQLVPGAAAALDGALAVLAVSNRRVRVAELRHAADGGDIDDGVNLPPMPRRPPADHPSALALHVIVRAEDPLLPPRSRDLLRQGRLCLRQAAVRCNCWECQPAASIGAPQRWRIAGGRRRPWMPPGRFNGGRRTREEAETQGRRR